MLSSKLARTFIGTRSVVSPYDLLNKHILLHLDVDEHLHEHFSSTLAAPETTNYPFQRLARNLQQ